MRNFTLFAPLLISQVIFVGCRLATQAPDPEWVASFDQADAILVQRHRQQITISDAGTINRFKQIYTNAKWKPYMFNTLPSHLGERTITLIGGENRLRSFSYTGTLWETESYTENRTTQLSEIDRQWIESLFAALPESETPADAELGK